MNQTMAVRSNDQPPECSAGSIPDAFDKLQKRADQLLGLTEQLAARLGPHVLRPPGPQVASLQAAAGPAAIGLVNRIETVRDILEAADSNVREILDRLEL